VVWGADDRVAPVGYADRWPGEKVVVPDAGHLVEWDAPDAVGAVLTSFLRS
jgi:pimeloyl-ACP methyl ester carboxylesterase